MAKGFRAGVTVARGKYGFESRMTAASSKKSWTNPYERVTPSTKIYVHRGWEDPYVPNEIPLGGRITLFFSSIVIIAYASIGLAWGYLFIPLKRGGSIIFMGVPSLFLALALLLAAGTLVLQIIDHYDKRNNEHEYAILSRKFGALAWLCVVFGIVISISKVGSTSFEGFASAVPLDYLGLRSYESTLGLLKRKLLLFFFISVIFVLILSFFGRRIFPRAVLLSICVMFFLMGLLLECSVLQDAIDGHIKIRFRRAPDISVGAAEDPRLFKAMLYSHAIIGLMMLGMAIIGIAKCFLGNVSVDKEGKILW